MPRLTLPARWVIAGALALGACSDGSGSAGSGDAGDDDARTPVADVAARDIVIDTVDVPDIAEDVDVATDAVVPDDVNPDDANGDASDVGEGSADAIEPDASDASDADELEPIITDLFPTVARSDALIYIAGENLGVASGSLEGISARVSSFSVDGEIRTPLEVVSAVERQMILRTPDDFAEKVGATLGLLEVFVPAGSARWLPIYATVDTTFSGKGRLGSGLRGNVYRIIENAAVLPNLDRACTDPLVVTGDGVACPIASVVADDLDVPNADWGAGFPGLSQDLREWFAIRFAGAIRIPEAGVWRFQSCSDDGSKLFLEIDDVWTEVIDNDGQHAFVCATGQAELPEGWTGLHYDFFQGPRFLLGLQLQYWGPSDTGWRDIDPDELRLNGFDEID